MTRSATAAAVAGKTGGLWGGFGAANAFSSRMGDGGNKGFKRDPYIIQKSDIDWRGRPGTPRANVDAAVEKAKSLIEEVDGSHVSEPSKWGKDKYGKSFPTEWKANNGAEISIDFAHLDRLHGPDIPHVGFQNRFKTVSGHILLDEVPFGRTKP